MKFKNKLYESSSVIANIQTIKKNFPEKDKYDVYIFTATKPITIYAQFTNEVWDDFDQPVMKKFKKGAKLKLDKNTKGVLVTWRIEGYYGIENVRKTYYICIDKDEWYSITYKDEDMQEDFDSCVDLTEIK